MKNLLLVLALICLALPAAAGPKDIARETLDSQGKTRTYYLYVPKTLKPETPAPLLVLLHGSGRNGLSLAEKWTKLADKEGIILVGPDSTESGWTPSQNTAFLNDLVKALQAKHPVNPRRVYLFGHSAGAGYALVLSLLQSEYFAATAIHAGALPPGYEPLLATAKRKTPVSIIVGTNDEYFPLTTVRATRDAFNEKGFAVELTEIPKHNHWYYDLAPKINQMAWDFLERHELGQDPVFQAEAGKVKIKRTVSPPVQ